MAAKTAAKPNQSTPNGKAPGAKSTKGGTAVAEKPMAPAASDDGLDLDTTTATGAGEGEAATDDGGGKAPAAEPKPAKGGKGKKADAPAEGAAPPAPDYSAGFEVYDIPIEQITPNTSRTPTEAMIADKARSIRSLGQLDPIIIGSDFKVIDGNTRLAACIKLGHKTIPARVGVDAKGNRIDSKGSVALLQTLAANVARDNFTMVEEGHLFRSAIKMKVAENAKDLSAKLGCSNARVSRAISVVERGTKAMQEAINAGNITADAAATLVERAQSPAEQDALLQNLLKAAEGRITREQVSRAKPAVGKKGKQGRRPTLCDLSSDALKSLETGITGKVRKEQPVSKSGLGGHSVVLTIVVHHDGETFARFDLPTKIQRALAKLDEKALRQELEVARQRLNS